MTVSVLIVPPLLDLVAGYGVSREALLSAARFDLARLEDVDIRLEISELDRLLEAALALTGDPALGIHMVEQASAPAYDVVGYLVTHASTLRDGIEGAGRFSRILSDVDAVLEEAGDIATLVFSLPGAPSAPTTRLRAEQAVAGFLRVIRTFCGEDAMAREALFQHAAPPYRAEYTRLFGGRERFEQPVTALRFDRALLSRETLHKNPRLSALFESEAERMLQRLERPLTVTERLRTLLGAQRVNEAPTMDEVAQRLGMSARSLRRRLAEEGVSFPKLVEEAQAAYAKQLLENPDRSIYQVAFDMGFSDPSAFHRAFRRWTGMTPLRYRENLRSDT